MGPVEGAGGPTSSQARGPQGPPAGELMKTLGKSSFQHNSQDFSPLPALSLLIKKKKKKKKSNE